MTNAQYVLLYFMCINTLTFIVYGSDKYMAKNSLTRVPEFILFALAILFGSVGAWSAMYFFHHKTKQLKFVVGLPLIFLAQVAFVMYVLQNIN